MKGHDIFDCGELSPICRTCHMEGDEALASVKCGDQKGYKRFLKKREEAFERTIKDASIHLALSGVKPLADRRQAPRLKRMMMDRFRQMTGRAWDEVKP